MWCERMIIIRECVSKNMSKAMYIHTCYMADEVCVFVCVMGGM